MKRLIYLVFILALISNIYADTANIYFKDYVGDWNYDYLVLNSQIVSVKVVDYTLPAYSVNTSLYYPPNLQDAVIFNTTVHNLDYSKLGQYYITYDATTPTSDIVSYKLIVNILPSMDITSINNGTTPYDKVITITTHTDTTSNRYIDWGDGFTEPIPKTAGTYPFKHTYDTEGTYTIKIYEAEILQDDKTLTVDADIKNATISLLPLFEGQDISKLNYYITVDGKEAFKINETTSINNISGKYGDRIYISTDEGYYTTIPLINTNLTAYIGTLGTSFVPVKITSNENVIVKLGNKTVGYGNPAICTVPLGSVISVYTMDGKLLQTMTADTQIDAYVSSASQPIYIYLSKSQENKLNVVIQTKNPGNYRLKITKAGQVVYDKNISILEDTTTINTDITIDGDISVDVYNEEGYLVATKSLPYIENPNPLSNLSNEMILLSVLFIFPLFLIITGISGLDFSLIGCVVGALIMTIPLDFPYRKELFPSHYGLILTKILQQ